MAPANKVGQVGAVKAGQAMQQLPAQVGLIGMTANNALGGVPGWAMQNASVPAAILKTQGRVEDAANFLSPHVANLGTGIDNHLTKAYIDARNAQTGGSADFVPKPYIDAPLIPALKGPSTVASLVSAPAPTAPVGGPVPSGSSSAIEPFSAPAAPASDLEIQSIFDSGDGFTTVRMSDGTLQRRSGDRGTRNNNPGNLTGTLDGALSMGAIGVDHGGNYVFANEAAGLAAQKNMVFGRDNSRSIYDMITDPKTGYAPAGAANDPNDTNKEYPRLLRAAGWDLTRPLSSLTDEEQDKLLADMRKIEGTSDGKLDTQTVPGQRGDIQREPAQMLGDMTQSAIAAADMPSVRSGAPLAKKDKEKLANPAGLGLMAFGITLLGGGEIETALSAGLGVYDRFQGINDEKEAKASALEAIEGLPPELQQYGAALAEMGDMQGVADLFLSAAQAKAASTGAVGAVGPDGQPMAPQEPSVMADLTPEERQVYDMLSDSEKGKFLKEKVKTKTEAREYDQNVLELTNRSTAQLDGAVNNVLRIINQIEADGVPFDTMLTMASSNVGGTRASELVEALSQVEALVAFGTLQDMRAQSKTGAALGSTSDNELRLLASTKGSLRVKQGIPALRVTLEKILQSNADLRNNTQAAFNAAYGGGQMPTTIAAPTQAAPATGGGNWQDMGGGVRIRVVQ